MGNNRRVFFRCGIQRRRFSSVVGYNRRGFFLLLDTTEKNLRMAKKIFLLYPTTQEIFLPLYPTLQQNLMLCTVSQKNLPHCIPQCCRFSSVVSHNGRYFPPLWDTTEEVFFRCGIQRKKLSSIVGYNGRGFFPFWDTTEEVFFRCGIQWKKIIQRRIIFLNF